VLTRSITKTRRYEWAKTGRKLSMDVMLSLRLQEIIADEKERMDPFVKVASAISSKCVCLCVCLFVCMYVFILPTSYAQCLRLSTLNWSIIFPVAYILRAMSQTLDSKLARYIPSCCRARATTKSSIRSWLQTWM
jgi:hypothetical protein